MSEPEKMTVARAVEILREHDKWLDVGAGRPPFGPREFGKAISTVCDALEWRSIETAPKISPHGGMFGPELTLCEGDRVFDGAWFLRDSVSCGNWLVYDYGVCVDCNPTHWRPAPELPA